MRTLCIVSADVLTNGPLGGIELWKLRKIADRLGAIYKMERDCANAA